MFNAAGNARPLTWEQVERAHLTAVPAVQQTQVLKFDTLMFAEVHGLELLDLCLVAKNCCGGV